MDNFFSNLMDALLVSREQPYDVVFSIGGSNFWGHQAILSTRSKYFERMFDGCGRNTDKEVVELQGLDPGVFEEVLQYFYTEEISLNNGTVCGILKTANYLEMECLRLRCKKYLETAVNIDDSIDLWKLAGSINDSEVVSSVRQYIISNVCDIKLLPKFLELELDEMKKLVTSEGLHLSSRLVELMYAGIMAWINHSNERNEYLIELLNLLKMEHVSREFFNSVVSKEKLLLDNKEGTNWLMRRVPRTFDLRWPSQVKSLNRWGCNSKKQNPTEQIPATKNNAKSCIVNAKDKHLIIDGDGSSPLVYRTETPRYRMTSGNSLPETPRYCMTSGNSLTETPRYRMTSGNSLAETPRYCMTSRNSLTETPRNRMTSRNSLTETPRHCMTSRNPLTETPRHCMTSRNSLTETPRYRMTSRNSHLETPRYRMTSRNSLNSIEFIKEDLEGGLYRLGRPLNKSRNEFSVIGSNEASSVFLPVKKHLIILDDADKCYGFNVHSRDIFCLADRPKTPGFCAVSFRKNIHVFGGYNNTCGLEYNVRYNTWKEKSIWSDFQHHSGAVVDTFAYITGGYHDEFCQNSVYRYDFESNRIDLQPRMILNRASHGTAAYENCIYACGGVNGGDAFDLDLAERFDVREGIWSCLPSMAYTYGSCTATMHDGSLYVSNSLNGVCERFDFRRNQWESLPRAPGPMGSIVSYDSKLYRVYNGGIAVYSESNASWDRILSFNFIQPTVCSL
ncbi:uncharacterized protein LOC119661394 isoform X2 [Hermetia illucens]|nr:uncharacterized protein LOC119661394 isoform X2 [Hermetia illucens]